MSSTSHTSSTTTDTTRSTNTTIKSNNSCHSCKANLHSVQYVRCQLCDYKYCNRQRCVRKIGGSWPDIQYKFHNHRPCPHCVYLHDDTAKCINTNCNTKRTKHQLKQRNANIRSSTHHTSTPSGNTITRPYSSIIRPSTAPVRSSTQSHILANSATSCNIPPIQLPLANIPVTLGSPTTMISPRSTNSQSSYQFINQQIQPQIYNSTNELDYILDQFVLLNSVQLYIATSQHILCQNTAIPYIIQQYSIPGHSLLSAITPQLLATNNIPFDIQNRTISLMSQLIGRQQQRLLYTPQSYQSQPANNHVVPMSQYNNIISNTHHIPVQATSINVPVQYRSQVSPIVQNIGFMQQLQYAQQMSTNHTMIQSNTNSLQDTVPVPQQPIYSTYITQPIAQTKSYTLSAIQSNPMNSIPSPYNTTSTTNDTVSNASSSTHN